MNYLQQFGGMLNELEDGELKTNLLNAFGNVKLDFNQAIEKRNTLKDEFESYKSKVTAKLGGDIDTFEVPKQGDDLEKIKSDLEAKYNNDTQQLRDDISSWEKKYNDTNTQLENMMFNAEVEKAGLLNGFITDNPRVKEMLLSEIRDKLILQDGVFYVKDNATGDKARDIKTGDFLSAKSISDGMRESNEWLPFVKANSQAQGMGTPPQQSQHQTGKKWSDYTSNELVAISRENPALYNQLKETR